jgi:hypothetical protein
MSPCPRMSSTRPICGNMVAKLDTLLVVFRWPKRLQPVQPQHNRLLLLMLKP